MPFAGLFQSCLVPSQFHLQKAVLITTCKSSVCILSHIPFQQKLRSSILLGEKYFKIGGSNVEHTFNSYQESRCLKQSFSLDPLLGPLQDDINTSQYVFTFLPKFVKKLAYA